MPGLTSRRIGIAAFALASALALGACAAPRSSATGDEAGTAHFVAGALGLHGIRSPTVASAPPTTSTPRP